MKNIAIIYDLDDTILPTRSIPASTFQPIFDAIEYESPSLFAKSTLNSAFDALWSKPYNVVAKEYGFNEAMTFAGKNALTNTDYKLTLVPYDEFHIIRELDCKRFLVTTGITKLQQAKIDALFGKDDFEEIIIDDLIMQKG